MQSHAAVYGRRTAATTGSYCSVSSLPDGATAATSAGAPVIKLPTSVTSVSWGNCVGLMAGCLRVSGSAASWRASSERAGLSRAQLPGRNFLLRQLMQKWIRTSLQAGYLEIS